MAFAPRSASSWRGDRSVPPGGAPDHPRAACLPCAGTASADLFESAPEVSEPHLRPIPPIAPLSRRLMSALLGEQGARNMFLDRGGNMEGEGSTPPERARRRRVAIRWCRSEPAR